MLLGNDAAGANSQRLGTTLRIAMLGGVLGACLVMAFELFLRKDSLPAFLHTNDLDMAVRMALIQHTLAGGLAGATSLFVVAIGTWRSGKDLAPLERALWTLSPLALLPAVPIVMAHLAWRGKHENLLVVVIVLALLVEVLVTRAILAAPGELATLWRGAQQQVPRWLRRHGPFLIVLAGALFFAGFMSFYTTRWHYKLETGNFDLSINNNLIFGALHGKFLHSPVTMPEDPSKYGAIHVKLGTYVLLPFYALHQRAETLYIIQATLLGLGALPLYAFAQRHVSRGMAALIALLYLAYYPLHSAAFTEANYVPAATFFVLATVWAIEARRWVWFALAFVAACLMREDIPIGLAIAGAYFAASGRRPRAGLLMAALATGWFVYLRFFWMEDKGEWWFPSMYKGLWSPGEEGFKSVIKTLLSNPAFVVVKLVEKDRLYYLLHLLVPLAFLPARRWWAFGAFVPGIVLTLLATDYKPPTMFSFQYVMHWTPYLFLATPLVLASIAASRDDGRARVVGAAAAFAFSTLALQYNYGAFPARDGCVKGGYKTINFTFTEQERRRYADLQEVIRLIPPDASVAATENVGPHVSSRITLYSARYGPYDAEYYLGSSKELGLKETRPKMRAALESGRYGVLFRKGDFALMKRGYDTKDNAQLLADWFGKTDAAPPTRSPRPSEPAEPTEPEEPTEPVDPRLDDVH